MADLKAK